MNLIILDSFNIGGIEKRYLSIIEFLIKNKKDANFFFLINKACIKSDKQFELFSRSNNVRIFGVKSFFNKRPILRFIEYKIQYSFSFIQLYLFKKSTYDNTFFIGRNSLRFLNYFNSNRRIYELVYSGVLNDQIEFTEVFNMTNKFKMDFVCLTESIYKKSISLSENKLNPESTICFSNKSFYNVSEELIKDSLNLSLKEKVVTYISRLDDGKGVDLLIDIVKCTFELDKSIRFTIIGYGKLESFLTKKIKSFYSNYGIPFNVHNTAENSTFLNESLIFLSLQDNENFPSQSVLEAMYHNNYILSTNVGMSKLFVKNNNGELLESEAKLFASRIVALCDDFHNTILLGKESKKLILEEYNIDSYINFLNLKFSIFS